MNVMNSISRREKEEGFDLSAEGLYGTGRGSIHLAPLGGQSQMRDLTAGIELTRIFLPFAQGQAFSPVKFRNAHREQSIPLHSNTI